MRIGIEKQIFHNKINRKFKIISFFISFILIGVLQFEGWFNYLMVNTTNNNWHGYKIGWNKCRNLHGNFVEEKNKEICQKDNSFNSKYFHYQIAVYENSFLHDIPNLQTTNNNNN